MLEVDLPALAQFAISNLLFFLSFNPKTSLKPQQSTPLSVDDGVGFWSMGPLNFTRPIITTSPTLCVLLGLYRVAN
jgi:hypothetical protein